MPQFDPELVALMRVALDEVMSRVPPEISNTSTKAYLAECILKAAAQGYTSYNELLAAGTDQIQSVISMFLSSALASMCRAPNSQAECHFGAAIGLRAQLEGYAPTIPDYALDMHTMKGQGGRPWSRSLPQRGRQARAAADR